MGIYLQNSVFKKKNEGEGVLHIFSKMTKMKTILVASPPNRFSILKLRYLNINYYK